MKSVQKPYWVLLTLTLPQIILAVIFWRVHQIIGSLLTKQSEAIWLEFGLGLAVLWIGFTGYAVFALIRRRPVHFLAGITVFAVYIPGLYLAMMNLNLILPWNIPRWMLFWVAPEMFLITMIVPAIAYAMILLVTVWTPEPGEYKPVWDIVITIAVPAAWYLFFNVILGLIHYGPFWAPVFDHVFPILLILCTCVFLFTLSRLAYVFLRRRGKVVRLIVTPIVLVLPVVGLIVNQSLKGLFGDFSSPIYYILAVTTGTLLVIPAPKAVWLRLGLFVTKSILLSFTAYFFLVFLPFLPLAIPAILFAGTGFLILSPTILGVKHILSLKEDFLLLTQSFNKLLLASILLIGLLVIPGVCCLMAIDDGRQIQTALNALYRTGYETNTKISVSGSAIRRVLKNIENNKTDDGLVVLGLGERTPYLTSLYNWIVLDNLTIAQDRVRDLRRVFCDDLKGPEEHPSFRSRRFVRTAPNQSWGVIKDLKAVTTVDKSAGCFHSRVDLELYNNTSHDQQGFAVTIDIPAGCYVSNYDLVVDGKRKQGILADRRAATWTFQQIANERRDPGIIVYSSGSKIVLRVYPFAAQETRQTGVDLIHANPVTLKIGDKVVKLGWNLPTRAEVRTAVGAVLVPVAVKSGLPKVHRQPVYHFILDFSQGPRKEAFAYMDRVKAFIKDQGIKLSDVTITAANFNLTTVSAREGWQKHIAGVRMEGGFNPDRAVKTFLSRNYRDHSLHYPVMIIVTDNPDHWRLYENYELWRPTFPDGDDYYRLGADGRLYDYSYLSGEGASQPVALPKSGGEVLVWPDLNKPQAFLVEDGRDSVVLESSVFQTAFHGQNRTSWQDGLTMEAMGLALTMDPAHYRERELAIIQRSFKSGVMARATSFIVLENAAQEAAMRAKQEQLLVSKKVVDASEIEDVSSDPKMAEPGFWLLAILAVLAGLVRRIFRRQVSQRDVS